MARGHQGLSTLWRDNPDNLELGLRLAKVQRDAGQATDSLATVQQLRALPLPSSDDPRIDLAEASANNSLGEWKLGQAAAGKAAAKALDQSRRQLLADALSQEGASRMGQQDFTAATGLYKQALDIYRQSGDKGAEASTLNNLADAFQDQGDLTAAEKNYRDAREIYSRIGNKREAANTLANMGALLQKQGNLDGAQQLYEQALEIHRELNNKTSEAITLNNMADVLYDKGDLPGARARYEEVLAMYEKLGDKFGRHMRAPE